MTRYEKADKLLRNSVTNLNALADTIVSCRKEIAELRHQILELKLERAKAKKGKE